MRVGLRIPSEKRASSEVASRPVLAIKLQGEKVNVGELPHGYFGDLKKNYEAHNRDYTGVWQG